MFKLMGKVINALLGAQTILIWTNDFQINNKIKQPRVISFVIFTENNDLIMRGSRNFRQGGPGQPDRKSSDNFFFFFLVFSLFYRSQMVNFKEIYHFSRFQRGSNIFQGGGGGPIFSGGGGGPIAYSL